MAIGALRGVSITLQSLAVAGNGNVVACPVTHKSHVVTVEGNAHVTAGKVKIEAAHNPNYTGAWQLIGSEITVPTAGLVVYTFTGFYQFLRVRISVEIVGEEIEQIVYPGTVTVTYVGAP